MSKIAIIGGGASGMVAGIVAARRGKKVTIYEKSKKLGRKILATGNGRCNITNQNISIENYHSSQLGFVKEVLKKFSSNDAKKFFSDLGLEMVELGDNGRLYPMSLQSSCVVEFLENELRNLEVVIKFESEIGKIEKLGDKFIVLDSEYDAVLIASGSLAMPSLGSSDSGYRLVREFGHSLIKPFVSLVQLVCDDVAIHKASGVKVDAVINNSIRGDLLFTNYGLSGSVILDISREVSKADGAEIVIDLLPNINIDVLKSLLKKQFKLQKPTKLLLNGIINKKLIDLVFKEAKLTLDESLNTKHINRLAFAIKHLKVKVNGTKGVKSCEVMAGGIDTSDVDAKTMESKLVKGLYFSGEVLDVDGDCGGYNLHFAWASGVIMGSS